MFRKLSIAALAAGLATMPAAAVTYDAFASFNATQGAGNFFYGTFNGATFTDFTAGTPDCFITGSICLQQSDNHDVPGATKSAIVLPGNAFQYGSVNVPSDRLLVHPGSSDSIFIAFQAPTAAYYSFTGIFNTQDTSPTGIDILSFLNTAGSVSSMGGIVANTANNILYTKTAGAYLNAGDRFGFLIDKDGTYGNDSTGVNISASVPEPASWAMMIGGFGLIGAAARRRARGAVLAG